MAPCHPAVLERWEARPRPGERYVVVPDGCRDLIVFTPERGRRRWWLSALDVRAWSTPPARSGRLCGYRLRPGTTVDTRALTAALAGAQDDDAVERALASVRAPAPALGEALARLAKPHRSIAECARELGLSPRSLQRLVSATERPPTFWSRLARLRRAARELASHDLAAEPIVEIADHHGYADQPHLTRECTLWLGVSPARLRGGRDRLARAVAERLGDAGYDGATTGVQSSIRAPFGSLT